MAIKTYSELMRLSTFEERLDYLLLNGHIGEMTFNGHRYLNQKLYQSYLWKNVKRKVIIRDNGCDLACKGYEIQGVIIVHHINPVTIEDIMENHSSVFDMENLISTSLHTHNHIHYGVNGETNNVTIRSKNDTCLWR